MRAGVRGCAPAVSVEQRLARRAHEAQQPRPAAPRTGPLRLAVPIALQPFELLEQIAAAARGLRLGEREQAVAILRRLGARAGVEWGGSVVRLRGVCAGRAARGRTEAAAAGCAGTRECARVVSTRARDARTASHASKSSLRPSMSWRTLIDVPGGSAQPYVLSNICPAPTIPSSMSRCDSLRSSSASASTKRRLRAPSSSRGRAALEALSVSASSGCAASASRPRRVAPSSTSPERSCSPSAVRSASSAPPEPPPHRAARAAPGWPPSSAGSARLLESAAGMRGAGSAGGGMEPGSRASSSTPASSADSGSAAAAAASAASRLAPEGASAAAISSAAAAASASASVPAGGVDASAAARAGSSGDSTEAAPADCASSVSSSRSTISSSSSSSSSSPQPPLICSSTEPPPPGRSAAASGVESSAGVLAGAVSASAPAPPSPPLLARACTRAQREGGEGARREHARGRLMSTGAAAASSHEHVAGEARAKEPHGWSARAIMATRSAAARAVLARTSRRRSSAVGPCCIMTAAISSRLAPGGTLRPYARQAMSRSSARTCETRASISGSRHAVPAQRSTNIKPIHCHAEDRVAAIAIGVRTWCCPVLMPL